MLMPLIWLQDEPAVGVGWPACMPCLLNLANVRGFHQRITKAHLCRGRFNNEFWLAFKQGIAHSYLAIPKLWA
jgi:hypothetical protein